MSDAAIKRIEKALRRLGEQQEEVLERLSRLEASSGEGAARASDSEVLAFLDAFRAGEALGEASLGAWIAVSEDACLRGGLRTVQQREGMHERLLAERIKELGGETRHEIPDAVHDAVMADAGNAEKPDADKVRDFVKRFPDIDAALAPICELADRLGHDPETRSLLRTIAQDERSTLAWFHETCAQLA